jgi:hypothetical protein
VLYAPELVSSFGVVGRVKELGHGERLVFKVGLEEEGFDGLLEIGDPDLHFWLDLLGGLLLEGSAQGETTEDDSVVQYIDCFCGFSLLSFMGNSQMLAFGKDELNFIGFLNSCIDDVVDFRTIECRVVFIFANLAVVLKQSSRDTVAEHHFLDSNELLLEFKFIIENTIEILVFQHDKFHYAFGSDSVSYMSMRKKLENIDIF